MILPPDKANGAFVLSLAVIVDLQYVFVAKPAEISQVSTFNNQLPIPWAASEPSPVILQIPAHQMWQLP